MRNKVIGDGYSIFLALKTIATIFLIYKLSLQNEFNLRFNHRASHTLPSLSFYFKDSYTATSFQ